MNLPTLFLRRSVSICQNKTIVLQNVVTQQGNNILSHQQQRPLSSTPCLTAGGKLRVQRGQAEDATSYGPITDLPDFTVVKKWRNNEGDANDGQVGLTKRQMKRQMRRVSLGATITSLLKEIDEQKVETGKYSILEEEHKDY